MHDPMTLVATIKIPFTDISVLDIWHVDPCKDGHGDDSCGWFMPRLNAQQRNELTKVIQTDLMYFNQKDFSHLTDMNIVMSAWNTAAWVLGKQRHWDVKSTAQIYSILMLANNIADGFVGTAESMRKYPKEFSETYTRLVFQCSRSYLDLKRKWWQHPRYHVHHYKINILPLRKLRRFLFDRCKHCGGRFKWGESPVTDSWNARDFKWWHSDPDVYHSSCNYRAYDKAMSERTHK